MKKALKVVAVVIAAGILIFGVARASVAFAKMAGDPPYGITIR